MVLYGWQRKVALLPLSLLVLGWVVFSVGFVWGLTEIPGNAVYSNSRSNPLFYSHYVLLVGGPFVYVLGVAQAIWPGTASAVLGIPTAFVSTVYLVAAGARSYDEAIYFRNHSNQTSNAEPGTQFTTTQRVAMLVGAAFITVCWCFVLMLSVCYKSWTRTDHGHYELFDQQNSRSRISRKCPFTPGVARGLSIPFIILSAVGWCLFVAGIERSGASLFTNGDAYMYPLCNYGAIVVGPLLFLAALLHAGCSGEASTVMGVFASLLSSVYVVFMGSMVTVIGTVLYRKCQNPEVNKLNCSFLHSSLDINWIYAFSGGVGSLFFWTCVLALRPFYRNRSQEDQGSNVINATNPHYGTMRLEESFSNGDTHSPL